MTTIGNLLKTLRSYKGVSQNEIANALFVQRSTYSKIEQGQTSLTIDLAVRIASFFGMEFNYFALCLEFEKYLYSSATQRIVKSKKNQEKLSA